MATFRSRKPRSGLGLMHGLFSLIGMGMVHHVGSISIILGIYFFLWVDFPAGARPWMDQNGKLKITWPEPQISAPMESL